MTKLKVLLCGYHRAASGVLSHLLARPDVAELAVFTHEPSHGAPDLATAARERGLWCSTADISRTELPFAPDLIASVYYRHVISPAVIAACAGRIFNMHPSLLPRHRGCSSVPWAIIEGDQLTGVSFHYIEAAVDRGPLLLQATLPIEPAETQSSLYERCMELGVAFFPAAFELVKRGVAGVPQGAGGCHHRRGAPFGGAIDPAWPRAQVERFIRAMTYPPYPYATFQGHEVKTLEEYDELARGAA